MVGLPRYFNTKQDVENAIECVKNKTELMQMIGHLDGYKATRTIKVLKPESADKDSEKITADDYMDAPNPRSTEIVMGFAEGELDALINKAQKKIKEF